jgi:hypothetical protein
VFPGGFTLEVRGFGSRVDDAKRWGHRKLAVLDGGDDQIRGWELWGRRSV